MSRKYELTIDKHKAGSSCSFQGKCSQVFSYLSRSWLQNKWSENVERRKRPCWYPTYQSLFSNRIRWSCMVKLLRNIPRQQIYGNYQPLNNGQVSSQENNDNERNILPVTLLSNFKSVIVMLFSDIAIMKILHLQWVKAKNDLSASLFNIT